MRAEWRERAEAILAGNNPAELVDSVRGERDRRPVLTPQQVPALVDEVVETLSHKVGSWTVFSVTAEIERRLRGFSFADDEQLRAVHDDALELALRDYCLPIDVEEYHLPERISDRVERGRRRSLLVDRAQMRYTAQAVLDAEDFMRRQADTGDVHTVAERIIRRTLRRIEQANGHELGPISSR